MKLALLGRPDRRGTASYDHGDDDRSAMLADALITRGHDVTFFAKELSAAANVEPLDRQSSGFDAVVSHSLSTLSSRFRRDQPMMTILNDPPTITDLTSAANRPDRCLSTSQSYVTVSTTNAIAWRPILPEVAVVHNGIHLDRWNSTTSPVPGLAVWAAPILPEKGLHLAIDAARLAGMSFEFAGPIVHSDYFATEIVPRLGATVRYRGHLATADLRHFFASGSVFVASPIWAEPFGISVIEALASGTPVAAFPSGALPELIATNAGSIAADTTATSLAAAISVASVCDRESARRSSNRFDFDSMVDRYERVLQDLVERNGTRGRRIPAETRSVAHAEHARRRDESEATEAREFAS